MVESWALHAIWCAMDKLGEMRSLVSSTAVKGKTGIELLKVHAVHIASVVTFCCNLCLNIWIPHSLAFFIQGRVNKNRAVKAQKAAK